MLNYELNTIPKHRTCIALDIETTGLNPRTDEILSIALCSDGKKAHIFKPFEKFIEIWNKGYFDDTLWVLHNAKFDMHFLELQGIKLHLHSVEDTMLLDHLIDENRPHSLDSIVKDFYNDDYKERFWNTYKKFEDAPEDAANEYAAKDVIYTYRYYGDCLKIIKDKQIPNSLLDHVHKLGEALYYTEYNGIKLDIPYLMELGVNLKSRINELKINMREQLLHEINILEFKEWKKELDKRKTERGKANVSKPVFNFDSSKQLAELLYGSLKLPIQRHQRTKSITTDDSALEALKGQHVVIETLQEYKGHNKVYTAFIEGTLERKHNDRIYPSFNINGTVTGRISSSNPNMQQLPREGKIRGIYIPDDDYYFISCDYSQLEVVIAAHFSMDPNLLKIVWDGASKHDITAQALGIERHHAKTLNFAMQYQCSPRKVAFILGCSKDEAQLIWNKYWETYAKEKEVIDWCKKQVDQGISIRNPFGRLRHFPRTFETEWQKEAAYRQAYSSLIQGTGSDITHWAFYTTNSILNEHKMGRTVFEVHDEILIQSKKDKSYFAREILIDTMIKSGVEAKLKVPLKVECSEPLERWEK